MNTITELLKWFLLIKLQAFKAKYEEVNLGRWIEELEQRWLDLQEPVAAGRYVQ